jgi:hypothetical protein
MKMLKREIYLFFSATAFVVLCAWAWGGPFVASASNPVAVEAEAQPAQAASAWAGTVLREGNQLVFRAATGQVYRLDQPQEAQAFAGQPVTLTGSLDAHSDMVHVRGIHPGY